MSVKTISIHAPYKRERLSAILTYINGRKFQSTLPIKGSDQLSVNGIGIDNDFNPRSL